MPANADILEDIETNAKAYEGLRGQLEKDHWGEWAIVIRGQLVAVAPTMEDALQRGGNMPPEALSRLVRKVGEELPKVVRKL
jgi:hypothetical protein